MTYFTIFPRAEPSIRIVEKHCGFILQPKGIWSDFKKPTEWGACREKSTGVAILSLQKAIVNYLWPEHGPGCWEISIWLGECQGRSQLNRLLSPLHRSSRVLWQVHFFPQPGQQLYSCLSEHICPGDYHVYVLGSSTEKFCLSLLSN